MNFDIWSFPRVISILIGLKKWESVGRFSFVDSGVDTLTVCSWNDCRFIVVNFFSPLWVSRSCSLSTRFADIVVCVVPELNTIRTLSFPSVVRTFAKAVGRNICCWSGLILFRWNVLLLMWSTSSWFSWHGLGAWTMWWWPAFVFWFVVVRGVDLEHHMMVFVANDASLPAWTPFSCVCWAKTGKIKALLPYFFSTLLDGHLWEFWTRLDEMPLLAYTYDRNLIVAMFKLQGMVHSLHRK